MNKDSVKSITDSRIFWAVISLLGALMLWLYVTGTEGVPAEKIISGVPVVLLGQDELRDASGLVVTEQDTSTVELRLSGLRRNIGSLNNSNTTAVIDLSAVRSDGHYTMLYQVEYPPDIKADDITLTGNTPETVSITVERYVSQTVEVDGVFTGSAAEGFLANDTLSFDPLSVKVSGPKSAVEKVAKAWVTISRENVDSTLSYNTTYTLVDKDGNAVDASTLTLDVEEVNVTLTVLMTKTVALTATVIDGGGATGESNAIVRVDPASIVLAGTAETLAAINQIVVDTIPLAGVNPIYEQSGLLITLPNDTVNLSGITSASVRVEIQGLATKSITATSDDMVYTNLAEGNSAEIITEMLPVTVRTTPENLARISSKNLRVIADLTDIGANTGDFYVPVKIQIDGFPEAGVIGEYKVYIRLKPAT